MTKPFLRSLLSVRPLRCMVHERFEVRVQGLLPRVRVTLLRSEGGDFWEGFGHYVSDETGNVKVSEDASLDGSYNGVQPMGLLWSMKPIPGSGIGLRLRKMNVQAQTDVHISVYKDHLTHGFQEKAPIVSVVAQRWYMAPGIKRVDVTENKLKGTIFIPPAIMLLRQHPQPRCIVCIIGSHITPGSGSSLVDMLGLVKRMTKKLRYDEEQRHIRHDSLLPIPDDPLNKVEVGRIKCPILLIVGEDDQICPASESADDIKQMMARAGNSHLLTVLSYPGAGHLIEAPYTPHCQASNFMLAGTETKVMLLWGGQTEAHSQAQEDSWHKILAFLEQHLYRNTSDSSQS